MLRPWRPVDVAALAVLVSLQTSGRRTGGEDRLVAELVPGQDPRLHQSSHPEVAHAVDEERPEGDVEGHRSEGVGDDVCEEEGSGGQQQGVRQSEELGVAAHHYLPTAEEVIVAPPVLMPPQLRGGGEHSLFQHVWGDAHPSLVPAARHVPMARLLINHDDHGGAAHNRTQCHHSCPPATEQTQFGVIYRRVELVDTRCWPVAGIFIWRQGRTE